MILSGERNKLSNTEGKLISLLQSIQSLLMLQSTVGVTTLNHYKLCKSGKCRIVNLTYIKMQKNFRLFINVEYCYVQIFVAQLLSLSQTISQASFLINKVTVDHASYTRTRSILLWAMSKSIRSVAAPIPGKI